MATKGVPVSGHQRNGHRVRPHVRTLTVADATPPGVDVATVKTHADADPFAVPATYDNWDRTGIDEIDTAIAEFLCEPVGGWTTDSHPIGELADGELAHGACREVSEQFVEFAQRRGLRAYVCDTDLDELGYQPTGTPRGEVIDHRGRIVPGHYYEHTVAEVYLPGQAQPITIDFTASQYGYTKHPHIT